MTMTAPLTGDLLTVQNPLARVRYFFGQLLTQRDLSSEQAYHLTLRRLVQREAFGTGTVAGLGVTRIPAATGNQLLQVVINPGFGLDSDGRELLLANPVVVTVVPLPVIPEEETSYGTTSVGIAASVIVDWHFPLDAVDLGTLLAKLQNVAQLPDVSGDTYRPVPTPDSMPNLGQLLANLGGPPPIGDNQELGRIRRGLRVTGGCGNRST